MTSIIKYFFGNDINKIISENYNSGSKVYDRDLNPDDLTGVVKAIKNRLKENIWLWNIPIFKSLKNEAIKSVLKDRVSSMEAQREKEFHAIIDTMKEIDLNPLEEQNLAMFLSSLYPKLKKDQITKRINEHLNKPAKQLRPFDFSKAFISTFH